jgi:uncharacterized protein YjbI with pentapeptide repeats
MKQITALIVITTLLILALPGVSYSQVSTEEKEALSALKVFIRTHSSKKDRILGWRGDWDTIANWEGLTLKDGKVTGIDLSSKDLQGELPRAISKLKHLETLVLNHNKLTRIPIELGELKHLKTLSIYHNKLQGPIPKELGKLENLQSLNLSDNDLSGTIPPQLGKLSRLRRLDLSDNDLSGAIPSQLGKLNNLRRLNLSDNDLSGAIPQALGTLLKLVELDLSENRFSGPVPRGLRNLSNLETLDISKNKLRGVIPNWIMRLSKLKTNRSDFRWNALYVPVKDEYRNLRKFLSRVQKDRHWKQAQEQTQTVAPTGIDTEAERQSITVRWRDIPFVSQNGHYIVYHKKKDAPGNYKEIKLKKGEGNSKKITGLEPSTTYLFKVRSVTRSQDNKNQVISDYSYIETTPTRGTTISGSVKCGDKPLSGVKVKASGLDAVDETGDDGKFYLNVKSGWSGKLTVHKKGYEIFPDGHAARYADVAEDIKDQHFLATVISVISGKVKDKNGRPVAGVELTFSRQENHKKKNPVTVSTDKNGCYSHIVKPGWKGSVTPAKEWYPFEPGERTFPRRIFSAIKNQDFEAQVQVLTGRVTSGKGKGLKKQVELTLVDGKDTPRKLPEEQFHILTNKEDGSFSVILPAGWTGALAPEKAGYYFYPGKRVYPDQTFTADPKQSPFNFRAQKDWRFSLSASGTYMLPAQETFSDTYGSGQFTFGIKSDFKFFRSFYVWAGYDYASAKGNSPVLKEETAWKQRFISLGLGYNKNLSRPFDIAAEAGIVFVNYREKALGENKTGHALGLRINGAGIFKIGDTLFTSFTLTYLWTTDTIDAFDDSTITIKLGGFKTGVGLGVRF